MGSILHIYVCIQNAIHCGVLNVRTDGWPKSGEILVKRLFHALPFLFLLALPTIVEAASTIRGRLPAFNPGDDVTIGIVITADADETVEYDFTVKLQGTWWGGGQGPAYSDHNAELYWMACSYGQCTLWWRGTVPAGTKGKIFMPVTTNPNWNGGDGQFIPITGTMNGEPFSMTVPVRAAN
jgi:hypothetical protein